jgi:hypothetical protein
VAGLVELLPGGEKVFVGWISLLVVLSDGVADEEELEVAVSADLFDDGVVTSGPPGDVEAVGGEYGRGEVVNVGLLRTRGGVSEKRSDGAREEESDSGGHVVIVGCNGAGAML